MAIRLLPEAGPPKRVLLTALTLPRPQFPHLLNEEIEVRAQHQAYLNVLGVLQPTSFRDEIKHFYNSNDD